MPPESLFPELLGLGLNREVTERRIVHWAGKRRRRLPRIRAKQVPVAVGLRLPSAETW